MITGELTWQQFRTLDSVRNLNENQQMEHYYKYLVELNDWISHQNKGPLAIDTPSGTVLSTSSIIINTPQASMYFYDVDNNISTVLTVPNTSSLYNSDIAHTENKLWTNGGNKISEWNITLNPFTATFNRIIDVPHNTGAGLGAINDTTLITSNTSVFPNSVVTLDITNQNAISTYKFDLSVGGSSRTVAGDILLTTTGKVLVTNQGATSYITQFNYATGVVENDIEIGGTIASPFGVCINDDRILIANGNGNVYTIGKNSPYGITLLGNTGVGVFGASQVPSALSTNFT
jgi:hypothetical protein